MSCASTTVVRAVHAVNVAARRPAAAAAVVVVGRRTFATSSMARADDRTPESGHTARSQGFSKREKAEEDKYILEREREKYRLAQQKLEKQKKELDELEAKHKSSGSS